MVRASCRRSISRISQGFTSAPRSRWRMSMGPSMGFTRRKKPRSTPPVSTTSPSTGESTRTSASRLWMRNAVPLACTRDPGSGRSTASGVPSRRAPRSSSPTVTVPSASGRAQVWPRWYMRSRGNDMPKMSASASAAAHRRMQLRSAWRGSRTRGNRRHGGIRGSGTRRSGRAGKLRSAADRS